MIIAILIAFNVNENIYFLPHNGWLIILMKLLLLSK
jgi:hypothetical protein